MSFVNTLSGAKERLEPASLTVANANTDAATGTYVDLATAPATGAVVTSVDVNARGSSVDGFILFYLYDGANRYGPYGDPLQVSARTVSGSVLPWAGTWYPPGRMLKLPPGWKLQAAPRDVTSSYQVITHVTDNN